MKKFLLSIASVALMMSACTQDVVEQTNGNLGKFDGNVTVTATMAADTRTAMAENAQGGLDITWVEGDEIGLSAEDDNAWLGANIKYTANQSAASTGFVCAEPENAIKWGEGTHNFWAYYPYTEGGDDPMAVPASVPAVQKQSAAGNTDHLQDYAFLYASATTEGIPANGNIDLQFNNAFSVLELDVCAESGSVLCEGLIFRADDESEIVSAENILVNLEDGSLNYEEATTSNEIRIDLGEGVELNSTTAQKFYMLITPGHGGKRFSFYAVVNGKEVLLGNKGIPAAGIPAGRKAELALNVPVTDLSAEGTANCYIVNKANTTYKFKATVMGNGATATYNWTGGGNDNTRTISESDITLAPASAKLLWTTNSATNTVVTDITLKDGYIYFKTPDSFINGNCVIAAMDESNNVAWSWHIWAVENYDDNATAKPIKSLSVMLMDRNLGATKSTEQSNGYAQAEVVGLKYQWGRKDPFPAPVDMDANDGNHGGRGQAHYSPDGSISYYTYALNNADIEDETNANEKTLYRYYNTNHGFQQVQASTFDNNFDGAVAQSIKEPWRYHMGYTNAFGGNDNNYIYSYLWGNPTGSAGGGTKTIYDPCPVGWKVASTAVFDALKSGETTYLNYGVLCGDHYISRTGRGDFANSHVWYGDCKTHGYLWTDNCYSNYGYGTAYVFEIKEDSKKIWAEGKYGTTGFGVRCVSEGTVDLSNYAINLSANGTSNCYIVNTPDEVYRFKATVKGNGTTALTGESANIAPTNAYLLWAQSQPMADPNNVGGYPSKYGDEYADKLINVKSVKLNSDGYIQFTTPSDMYNGNAVICATDNAGNILWSWHLWVVNGYNSNTTDVYVTDRNINTYMMDRNLGATGNPDYVAAPDINDYIAARGMCYQWGRKDPFPTNVKFNGYSAKGKLYDANGNGTSKYFNYNTAPINEAVDCVNSGIYNDIYKIVAWTTTNPRNYMSAWSNNYKWISTNGTTEEWGKLWGNQGWTGSSDKGGVKTMYDPCPAGYRVPSTGHFRFFTAHGDQASSGYGNNLCNWKFNSKELIYDESGNYINGHEKVEPYGLHFYYNGHKTESPDAVSGIQDYGVTPDGLKTIYFPAQGLITYGGSSYNDNIYVQTNAPGNGQTHWAKAESGNFYYNATSGSYDQQAKAMPVRCVRE